MSKTEQKYKIGDRVKFTDKDGIERVGVVYEAGSLFCRIETYVGIGKIRDVETSGCEQATAGDLNSYVEGTRNAWSVDAILTALNPAAIIEREKKEHPDFKEVSTASGLSEDEEAEED